MTLTHTVYVLCSIIFVVVLAYMFIYNTRLKTRQRTMELKGRPPISKEEGIAIATLEKERKGKTGSIS